MLGNGLCDIEALVEECKYDYGECCPENLVHGKIDKTLCEGSGSCPDEVVACANRMCPTSEYTSTEDGECRKSMSHLKIR